MPHHFGSHTGASVLGGGRARSHGASWDDLPDLVEHAVRVAPEEENVEEGVDSSAVAAQSPRDALPLQHALDHEERLTIVHLAYPWAASESGSSCECTGSVSMRCVVVVCSRQDHSSISCADALFGGSLGHVGASFDHSALLPSFFVRVVSHGKWNGMDRPLSTRDDAFRI